MRTERSILATAHRDIEGDMIAPEALVAMVEQINTSYLPIGIEHDPRIPPQGRVVSARMVQLDDGIDAIEGEIEFFEPGDQLPQVDQTFREIPLRSRDTNELEVSFDKHYSDSEDQAIVRDIAAVFKTAPQEEIKKSLDPLSVLIISGAFVLSGIATGFLNKLGADAWDALKEKLKQAMERKRTKENLLVFEFFILNSSHPLVAKVILTNPDSKDIDAFFDRGLNQVDRAMTRLSDTNDDLRQIVFEYSRNELRTLYGVRKDAVPLFLKTELKW